MEIRRYRWAVETRLTHHELKRQEQWGYDHFFAYLAHLSHPGFSRMLRHNEYPSSINIGRNMHAQLEKLWQGTEVDGLERYQIFGFDQFRTNLNFSPITVGGHDHISGDLIELQHRIAPSHGIRHRVGNIHTHPGKAPENIDPEKLTECFSVEDLYFSAKSGGNKENKMSMVVGPTHNLAVFQSRDTLFRGISDLIPQDQFADHYYRRYSEQPTKLQRILRKVQKGDIQLMRNYKKATERNKEIATSYKLALYAGLPSGILERIA